MITNVFLPIFLPNIEIMISVKILWIRVLDVQKLTILQKKFISFFCNNN